MAAPEDQASSEDYFNDLSQQLPESENVQEQQRRGSQDENEQVPKPKRMACVLCRKRKLKCDGNKPSCGTCIRLQHDCAYDEVRRKSGPKRGYVKALEARLAQVETLLKTQDGQPPDRQSNDARNGMVPEFENIVLDQGNVDLMPHLGQSINRHDGPAQTQFPHTMLGATAGNDTSMPTEETFPWEMIGLGLDEPLPHEDVVNDLNHAYFEKIHPSFSIIHRARYFAAMSLAPHMRPPVCLRYAMWCNAAAATDKYESLQEHFYLRARKYIQQDEMKGHGESTITIAHCQTWTLLSAYEFKLMYFPRAWMSSGRATRLAQMMGLHRLDGAGLDVKQCLPPPKDWTEREERRRTFWACFCVDRYSSIGTGWPMSIEEKDILTKLPADLESYDLCRATELISLNEALDPGGAPKLSAFGAVGLMACLFGRNLLHLHRTSPNDNEDDLNGEFWKRHRHIDNIILNTQLALPDSLRLPSGLNDPNVVFMNMNIHTSTICLHQAAIFKADKNRMPARISAESKVRCITAAAEIASIMRQISHVDLSAMNPFISFCLYVAARVFVQYLKSRPNDVQIRPSLQFLLAAMHAIKRKNPLTESFLVQLDVDLESAGLEDSRTLRAQMPTQPTNPGRSSGCPVAQMGLRPLQGDNTFNTDAETYHSTYGDQGLSLYTEPYSEARVTPPESNTESFRYTAAECIHGSLQLNLPSRQRTPGSMQGSAAQKSPSSLNNNAEMDTSPDNCNEQRTPSSTTLSQQNLSSHTSSMTGYSPQNQKPNQRVDQSTEMQQDQRLFTNILDPNTVSFGTEFSMPPFQASAAENQQPSYSLPQNWTGGNVGFASGVSADMEPNNGLGELMGITDTDWNQMLQGFNDWNPGVNNHMNINEMLQGRRM